MKKTYCDRCGEPVTATDPKKRMLEKFYYAYMRVQEPAAGWQDRQVDLCGKCNNKFFKLVNEFMEKA